MGYTIFGNGYIIGSDLDLSVTLNDLSVTHELSVTLQARTGKIMNYR